MRRGGSEKHAACGFQLERRLVGKGRDFVMGVFAASKALRLIGKRKKNLFGKGEKRTYKSENKKWSRPLTGKKTKKTSVS